MSDPAGSSESERRHELEAWGAEGVPTAPMTSTDAGSSGLPRWRIAVVLATFAVLLAGCGESKSTGETGDKPKRADSRSSQEAEVEAERDEAMEALIASTGGLESQTDCNVFTQALMNEGMSQGDAVEVLEENKQPGDCASE